MRANRMSRQAVAIGLALAVSGPTAAFVAFVGGQRVGVVQLERAVAAHDDLERWHARFDRTRRDVVGIEHDIAAALTALPAHAARLQTRILYLNALGARLAARAEFDGAQFNFGVEPAMGGPQEPLADSDAHGAALADAAAMLEAQLADRWLQFTVLEDLLSWRTLDAELRPGGRPLAVGYVSSRFGRRIDPFTGQAAAHRGIDFAAPAGSEIVAVASGIVVWSGPRSGYGETVEIDHGQSYLTRYAHNAENLVQIGDIVTRGQPIARLGATGRATGPNLHFEVLRDGRAVNPLPYID